MLGMAGQSGINDPLYLRMRFQPGCDMQRITTMPLHAQGQGFQAAQRQEAVKGTGNRANGVLQITQPFGPFPTPAHGNPANDVGMTIQILGRGMHHDVEAIFQGPLRPGRGEGVIRHCQNPAFTSHLRNHRQIHQP
jgi:hypothetical protein